MRLKIEKNHIKPVIIRKISLEISFDTKFGILQDCFLVFEGSLLDVIKSFRETSRAQKNVFENSSWRLSGGQKGCKEIGGLMCECQVVARLEGGLNESLKRFGWFWMDEVWGGSSASSEEDRQLVLRRNVS
jgi:hypothetical protein